MSALDSQLLKLVQLHAPIKARKLATILADEFGKHVDRSDVNSALYRMKGEGKADINASYEWSLPPGVAASTGNIKVKAKQKVKGKINTAISTRPAQAAIEFTKEQQAVIDLDPTQHLLIRGQAGSGKTTVLAARAGKILSATSKGTVLFLTYNVALCAYVKKAFTQAGMKGDIDVKTFHDWAKHSAQNLGATFNGWVDGKVRAEQLKLLIKQAEKELGSHRLYKLEDTTHLITWWGDELAWLFGQHIMRLDEYLTVERSNRGTAVRVTQEDRRFIWCVYELYLEWLEESRQEDYDNPAGLLLRTLQEQGGDMPDSLRYDHVMVDEVQDFDKSWLLAVVKVPKVSLSMAGDLAQKIYRRNFSWVSVGIQVQGGRSRRLASSHRTTQQIMDVAEYLLDNNDVKNSADYTVPVRPKKVGDLVKRLISSNPKQAYNEGYQWVADHFKRLRTTTVAVVMPFSRQLYPAQKALESLGLTVTKAKGASLGNFSGGVVVTTFHQLKGLEFDHVVIMGLHDAQYPGRFLEHMAEDDWEEENNLLRRVLYVAMTRAKESVVLIGSDPFCQFFKQVPSNLIEDIK